MAALVNLLTCRTQMPCISKSLPRQVLRSTRRIKCQNGMVTVTLKLVIQRVCWQGFSFKISNMEGTVLSGSTQVFHQVCTCGRSFLHIAAFSKHQKMCLKGKKRLSSVLSRAKEAFQQKKRRTLENNDPSRQFHNDVSGPHMDVDSSNQEGLTGNSESQTAAMDPNMAFVAEVDDRPLAQRRSRRLDRRLPQQFKDFLPEPLSPLPPHSVITSPLEDNNKSHANQASMSDSDSALLSDSTPSSCPQSFGSPDFQPEDVCNVNWRNINKKLGTTDLDRDESWLEEDAGWQKTPVTITVPFHTRSQNPGPCERRVVDLYHRSLVSLIREKLANPQDDRHFHHEPYQLLWCPPHQSGESHVYALMLWLDATHLTSFGNSKLWPLHVYFGNESKYRHSKPSCNLCNHAAYFERLPDEFKDFATKHVGNKLSDAFFTHCHRELFHAQWNVLLDEEFFEAYKHGIVIMCCDGVLRCFYPRIFTYSADYPEKILIASIRNLGCCPCPRCLVSMVDVPNVGSEEDMQGQTLLAHHSALHKPQSLDYKTEKYSLIVTSVRVNDILKPESRVPTLNAFSNKLGPFGFNVYSILVVDLMHEFELGVWKSIFIHLLKILECVNTCPVDTLDMRNSEMKKMAAHNFEDFLQCAIPVFEGLLPEPYNTVILHLLFCLVHWHSLAKLRMYTDYTITILEKATKVFGEGLRKFASETCPAFCTRELQREANAQQCRQIQEASNNKSSNAATASNAVPDTRCRPKTFNLRTYKLHALGDYPAQIRRFGTTNVYSTEPNIAWGSLDIPGLVEYIKQLTTNLQSGMVDTSISADLLRYSASTMLGHIVFKNDRINNHKILRINYTTYNIQQAQDVINPQTNYCNIMLLAYPDSSSSSAHPFLYAQVIGIYHANVISIDSTNIDYRPRRIEFLWVRWYELQACEPHQLATLCFVPMADNDVFGFVDPTDVLRACHLIPAFARDKSCPDGVGLSRCARDGQDSKLYYINRVLPLDTFTLRDCVSDVGTNLHSSHSNQTHSPPKTCFNDSGMADKNIDDEDPELSLANCKREGWDLDDLNDTAAGEDAEDNMLAHDLEMFEIWLILKDGDQRICSCIAGFKHMGVTCTLRLNPWTAYLFNPWLSLLQVSSLDIIPGHLHHEVTRDWCGLKSVKTRVQHFSIMFKAAQQTGIISSFCFTKMQKVIGLKSSYSTTDNVQLRMVSDLCDTISDGESEVDQPSSLSRTSWTNTTTQKCSRRLSTLELDPQKKSSLIENAIERIASDEPDENLTAEDRAEQRIFKGLLKLVPSLERRLMATETTEEDIIVIADMIQKGANGARSDDTKGLKSAVIDWITPKGQTLSPHIHRNVKANHERTGFLLCPAGLDWSDENTKTKLMTGQIQVLGDQWPIMLYANYSYNAEDSWNGLLRSSLLVNAFKHIFTSCSGNARIHVTNSERFYNSILVLLEYPKEKEEVDQLLAWWNRQIFPVYATPECLASKDSALARIRESKIAIDSVKFSEDTDHAVTAQLHQQQPDCC
ncbi:hypothetical protein SERLA73DRAFT_164395 [Serpula lacrymans var. lacrymans S7.3]|uniref:Uncharacterized protein n=1 Tax=Serpula lacrymans var. lacrymans (strain S7.3) TaxID=936435 RepID=F8QIZ3_SERL3|nr:hypothetical protein SERLA73DRAFT_164395 [Serpula lacrymans var. lacrymans S7.3]